ncbi:hypothetical protein OH492_23815 [Vibrio chagasii]|nr:hypothetical protein [Vibrio chagasii]
MPGLNSPCTRALAKRRIRVNAKRCNQRNDRWWHDEGRFDRHAAGVARWL